MKQSSFHHRHCLGLKLTKRERMEITNSMLEEGYSQFEIQLRLEREQRERANRASKRIGWPKSFGFKNKVKSDKSFSNVPTKLPSDKMFDGVNERDHIGGIASMVKYSIVSDEEKRKLSRPRINYFYTDGRNEQIS